VPTGSVKVVLYTRAVTIVERVARDCYEHLPPALRLPNSPGEVLVLQAIGVGVLCPAVNKAAKTKRMRPTRTGRLVLSS